MLVKIGFIFPKVGMKMKNGWNYHLDMDATFPDAKNVGLKPPILYYCPPGDELTLSPTKGY